MTVAIANSATMIEVRVAGVDVRGRDLDAGDDHEHHRDHHVLARRRVAVCVLGDLDGARPDATSAPPPSASATATAVPGFGSTSVT